MFEEYSFVIKKGLVPKPLERKVSIEEVVALSSLKCNLACRYCYMFELTKRQEFREKGSLMDEDVAKAIIDFLAEQKAKYMRVWLFGGEPTLNDDVIPVFYEYGNKKAKEKKKVFMLGMTTNGVKLADEEYCKWLSQYMKRITFSLDGCQKSHDMYRVFRDGRGSYKVVVQGLKNALKYFDVQVNFTVGTDTCQFIYEGVRNLINLGARNIVLEFAYELDWKPIHYRIVDYELTKLTKFLINEARQGRVYSISLYTKGFKQLFGSKPLHPRMRCGFAQGMVAVSPNGNIYACQRAIFRMQPLGNVFEGFSKEREIWMSCWDRGIAMEINKCKYCPYQFACPIGCIWSNYDANKDIYVVPKSFCVFRRLGVKHAMWLAMACKNHHIADRVLTQHIMKVIGERISYEPHED